LHLLAYRYFHQCQSGTNGDGIFRCNYHDAFVELIIEATMTSGSDISRRTFVGTLAATPFLGAATHAAGSPNSHANQERHAVVVGAGAFGGWTALALLRSGFRVTLIDAWGAGNARASSGGETRVIRAVYGGVAIYSAMVARALELWRASEPAWGRQVFFRTGALWLCATDDGYVRRSIEPIKAAGLTIEEMTPVDAARRFPQMNFADAKTVFYEPEAGYLTARAACELVRETFVREGGAYLQSWVHPVRPQANRLPSVTLSNGNTVEADDFVFACGPWLGQVFPDVIGSRIRPTRQEVFFFGAPAGNARYEVGSLPVWVHMAERVTYGVPSHERRGLKIADDTAGEEVDPTTMQRTATAAGIVAARAILKQRFPALANAPLLEARVCQYEASPQGHFLIDRHPQMSNAWLVGGGSGHGFKMGPALGEYVADVIQGKRVADSLFSYARMQ
jgi:glycine/D-amino acid oxidase-like deaminating enzyme